MTEPLKVTLPPWRRGDGSRFQSYGVYIVRDPGESLKRTWPMEIHQGDIMLCMLDYAGPIEFIETEREPEPQVCYASKAIDEIDAAVRRYAAFLEEKSVQVARRRGNRNSERLMVEVEDVHYAVLAMEGK